MAKGKYAEWLTEDGLTLIRAWARDGLTHEQIAHNMGIKRQTLYDWCNRHETIAEALKRGKAVVDYEVENALLKRALGYDVIEGDRVRHIPPDVGALCFWLKNRKPDVWSDRKNIDIKETHTNPYQGLSTEDLKKLIADE